MLDYTRAAGKKILDDIQKFSLVCSILTQVFYIVYLIYALWTDTGIFYANLPMLVLACAYFAFYCYHQNYGASKKIAKNLSVSFKWSKRIVKLFNLGVIAYGIFFTATAPTPVSIILSTLMAVFWVADLLFEFISKVVKSWWSLLLAGLQADVEIVTKPAVAVGNFFKRVSGKEVEEAPPPSKERMFLDGIVKSNREEKQDQKLQEKYLRAKAKAEKAERKRKEKELKKAAKRNPAPVVEEIAAADDEE